MENYWRNHKKLPLGGKLRKTREEGMYFVSLKRKMVGTQEINGKQEIPILDPVRKLALSIWLVDLGTKNYFIDRILE